MAAPVVHFEIHGTDGPKLAKFYDELFEWNTQGMEMPEGWYGMVANPDGGIGGGIAGNPEGSKVTVYIQVPDLDAKLQEIQDAGGKVLQPPTTIPDTVTFALFEDPAGNAIGLVKG